MDRKEVCVLTNMCMVSRGDEVLVIDRTDRSWPGLAFPGGHVEPGESFVHSVIREIKEETGLLISHVKLCGIKQWISKDNSYRYIVFLFKTDCYSGELTPSDEGNVFWVHKKDIGSYRLSGYFEDLLKVFFCNDLSENYQFFQEDCLISNLF